MLAPAILFGVSLFGIVTLFLVKKYELARGVLIGGRVREGADLFALRVKWTFLVVEWYLSRLPDFVLLFVRRFVRAGALFAARFAREAEKKAYHVADFVSHKRNFERRETKSNYLKQVTEHKNENGKGNGPVATL